MKAIEITQYGGPEVLRLGERPMPEPKAGEVLIRVRAAGVNRPDVSVRLRGPERARKTEPSVRRAEHRRDAFGARRDPAHRGDRWRRGRIEATDRVERIGLVVVPSAGLAAGVDVGERDQPRAVALGRLAQRVSEPLPPASAATGVERGRHADVRFARAEHSLLPAHVRGERLVREAVREIVERRNGVALAGEVAFRVVLAPREEGLERPIESGRLADRARGRGQGGIDGPVEHHRAHPVGIALGVERTQICAIREAEIADGGHAHCDPDRVHVGDGRPGR